MLESVTGLLRPAASQWRSGIPSDGRSICSQELTGPSRTARLLSSVYPVPIRCRPSLPRQHAEHGPPRNAEPRCDHADCFAPTLELDDAAVTFAADAFPGGVRILVVLTAREWAGEAARVQIAASVRVLRMLRQGVPAGSARGYSLPRSLSPTSNSNHLSSSVRVMTGRRPRVGVHGQLGSMAWRPQPLRPGRD
jgi:hypothetical protein